MIGGMLHEGDCRDVLPTLPEASADSVVTDPPYELGFMGASWDRTGIAFDPAMWASVLRVLKPGGYLLAFGGTRTYHRLVCAVEDAGFEVRDCLMWLYGTGFPKGQGCLKPAWEPILLARKPGKRGKRVLPLGIDACRVEYQSDDARLEWLDKYAGKDYGERGEAVFGNGSGIGTSRTGGTPAGRYPANVLHDGSDAVMEVFAAFGEREGGYRKNPSTTRESGRVALGKFADSHVRGERGYDDTGTAARFFYTAKASKSERGAGNTHPTVKPLALMRWLVRLVTPEGGTVLDPFAGSGTTLLAAHLEGRSAVGIESDAGHCAIIRKRLAELAQDQGLFPEAG